MRSVCCSWKSEYSKNQHIKSSRLNFFENNRWNNGWLFRDKRLNHAESQKPLYYLEFLLLTVIEKFKLKIKWSILYKICRIFPASNVSIISKHYPTPQATPTQIFKNCKIRQILKYQGTGIPLDPLFLKNFTSTFSPYPRPHWFAHPQIRRENIEMKNK